MGVLLESFEGFSEYGWMSDQTLLTLQEAPWKWRPAESSRSPAVKLLAPEVLQSLRQSIGCKAPPKKIEQIEK